MSTYIPRYVLIKMSQNILTNMPWNIPTNMHWNMSTNILTNIVQLMFEQTYYQTMIPTNPRKVVMSPKVYKKMTVLVQSIIYICLDFTLVMVNFFYKYSVINLQQNDV